MNGRAFLKSILLFILTILSYFFILVTNRIGLFGVGIRPILIPITLAINILLLERRKNLKKPLKYLNYILSFINISWIIYYLYQIIYYYLKWNSLEIDITYLYLILITITFITSLPDLKKETFPLNDILTMITTILFILIHYRYYLDQNFLHNIVGNTSDYNVLQNRYIYVTQYYIYFIIMYLTLFIQKKINHSKT